MRGNVVSYLFGKPPNPPKGDKLEKETNLPLLTYSAIAVHIPSCRWLSSKGNVMTEKERNDEG
ncbi:hypothetical protein HMPREF9078_02331 [Capnocytophaga sp. oral taxon 380 str. F0488]|nr:hypothetical protein HMPREF9078_02331 [Capnocytophaga sp. oral taxon 380 str. F0488]